MRERELKWGKEKGERREGEKEKRGEDFMWIFKVSLSLFRCYKLVDVIFLFFEYYCEFFYSDLGIEINVGILRRER